MPVRFRFRGDIEPVRFEPGRSTHDLTHMNVVGKDDEVVQGRVRGGEEIASASSHENGLSWRCRIGRLDRRHVKHQIGIGGHRCWRSRRRRNGPRGCRRRPCQIQRHRSALREGSRDRIAIVAQSAFERAANCGDSDLHHRPLDRHRCVDRLAALVDAVHPCLPRLVSRSRELHHDPQRGATVGRLQRSLPRTSYLLRVKHTGRGDGQHHHPEHQLLHRHLLARCVREPMRSNVLSGLSVPSAGCCPLYSKASQPVSR